MLFHEVRDPWVFLVHFLDGRSSPPGPFLVCGPSLGWPRSSSFPGVSFMLGHVAPFFVADETFLVSDMLSFLTGGEKDLVYVHGIRVQSSAWTRGDGESSLPDL